MKFIIPNWPAPQHIKAYTTTRQGFSGRKPYHDQNRDNISQDDAQESRHLQTLLNLPNEPIWLTQTHSTTVVTADNKNKETNADASYTQEKNQICVVMTADCLPILICNRSGTTIAAIHAGWRGLAGGIIEETIKVLKQAPDELMVWLGPAIGPSKFEVGKDVYDAFVTTDIDAATAFISHKNGKWLANLYTLARQRLSKLDVTQIYGGEYCTYTQDDLFYSYRRENGKTGRMASVIWIEG